MPCRTAALEATRDQLLQLKEQRTTELQASVARYAELEAALAAAEQSMEHVVDAEEVSHPRDVIGECLVRQFQAELEKEGCRGGESCRGCGEVMVSQADLEEQHCRPCS